MAFSAVTGAISQSGPSMNCAQHGTEAPSQPHDAHRRWPNIAGQTSLAAQGGAPGSRRAWCSTRGPPGTPASLGAVPNATQAPLFLDRFSPKFRPFFAIFRPFSPSRRQEARQHKITAEKRRKTGGKRPRNSGLGWRWDTIIGTPLITVWLLTSAT